MTVSQGAADIDDGLTVLAEAAWPESDDPAEVPDVAGFVISTFSPLMVAVTERCLTRFAGGPPLENGDRVAIVLLSEEGDIGLAAAVASAVDEGRRTGPVVFFQSVPSAVLGHVAERWGLSGPLVSS